MKKSRRKKPEHSTFQKSWLDFLIFFTRWWTGIKKDVPAPNQERIVQNYICRAESYLSTKERHKTTKTQSILSKAEKTQWCGRKWCCSDGVGVILRRWARRSIVLVIENAVNRTQRRKKICWYERKMEKKMKKMKRKKMKMKKKNACALIY